MVGQKRQVCHRNNLLVPIQDISLERLFVLDFLYRNVYGNSGDTLYLFSILTMREFVMRLFFFIAFTFLVYSGCIMIWGYLLPRRFQQNILVVNNNRTDFLAQRLLDIRNHRNIDILFL